jgi:hypothetical protein
LLGDRHAAWASNLHRIEEPVGLGFVADLGAGEQTFELTRDADGYIAIPTDGLTPRRLNVTEAEFAQLDMSEVLGQIRDAAGCTGVIEPAAGGVFRIGKRTIAGSRVALLVAPRGIGRLSAQDRIRLGARIPGVDVHLLLAPDLDSVPIAVLNELGGMKIAVTQLALSPPWVVDLSPLVEDATFDVPLNDPVVFFDACYAIIVDPSQQRVWLEGLELKVKADGQSYRLLEHLAGAPQTAVPVRVLANQVLEAGGDRLESKIVSDAKHELMKAIRSCLAPVSDRLRINVENIITVDDGRVMLNIDPSLVKVVRRLSER